MRKFAFTGALILALATPGMAGSVTPEKASRFLAQATLGADWDEIERTAEIGLDEWLDEQFAAPIGYHQPIVDELGYLGIELERRHRRWAWWQQVMQGPDPLRQRVALALSEIFVVSDNVSAIGDNPSGLASYYDMLLDNAFGNYRDLLHDVTMHPIMGVYLSHLRNRKSNPQVGQFPDENFAREIMQLFSIGLFELREDGTEQLDGNQQPIPTYDNGDITEFAKIFTGLSFDSADGDFSSGGAVWDRPMRMYPAWHEPGPKYLLRGKYVPPGQTAIQDLNDAIDNLFHHSNVGPFISRRLIQRLITSNPSKEYVERITAVFNNNGSGARGDLKAVVRAILTDPEAQEWPTAGDEERGRLRESFLRRVHLARAFNAHSPSGTWQIEDPNAPTNFGQRPLSSPTVFNFFLPDHQPAGILTEAGLYAPEFQIMTTVTAISSANQLRNQISGTMNSDDSELFEVRLDLSELIALAWDANALIDRLDLMLTYGHMNAAMRQILIQAVEQLDDPDDRAHMALHLVVLSPEYNVVK